MPLPANKQYVLVYPSYPYFATRQDDATSGGFFQNLQNFFVGFGGPADESSNLMDAIEPEKPAEKPMISEALPLVATKTAVVNEKPVVSQPKVAYSSLVTPASTVPLNADRRLFYLSEQPQIYGSFSGSALNPVFNLQPVPLVVSSARSNVAQVPDAPVAGNLVSENEKFSQVPPVMAALEPVVVPQQQAKSEFVREQSDAVVEGVPENRVAPVVVDNRAIPVPSTEATIVVEDPQPVLPAAVVPESRHSDVVAPIVAQEPEKEVIPNVHSSDAVEPVQTPADVSLKAEPIAISAIVESGSTERTVDPVVVV